jgi:hypothetical protein
MKPQEKNISLLAPDLKGITVWQKVKRQRRCIAETVGET